MDVPHRAEPELSVPAWQWLLATAVGAMLAAGVWWGLLTGSGLIGGDIYAYFLPQKVVMADAFAAGELPLWHRLTGLGYPLLAESQAGVFYPPNQALYRLLDVETAFHWGIVGHYVFAYVFAWRFARCQGLSNSSSLLAAVIFVYGWFPARISHEWSIIAGVWFPLTLWLTDGLLRRPTGWRVAALTACLTAHLLSGHFTLAFVCQLTIVGYAVLFWFWRRSPRDAAAMSSSSAGVSSTSPPLPLAHALLPMLCIGLAIGSAAIQLVPTYELKLASQRHGDEQQFDPAFGHLPPVYLTQLVASWSYWHTPELVQSGEFRTTTGAVAADTNHVEAHFYWGLIPFGLIAVSWLPAFRGRFPGGVYRTWLVLSLLSVIYATGWLMPVARHLPGFGFFNGPGRYTMVAALGGAIIAGLTLDALLAARGRMTLALAAGVIGGCNLADTLAASRYVADAVVVPVSAWQKRDDSWVRRRLLDCGLLQARLLAPGPNIGNFFGVSCVPQYLGLGPAVYYTAGLNPPTSAGDDIFPSDDDLAQLQQLGVTHLLTTERVPRLHPAVVADGAYPDAILNTVWGRGMAECFLYRLQEPVGRFETVPPGADIRVTAVSANHIGFDITTATDTVVTLKELMYPGWQVAVDGFAVEAAATSDVFRSVQVPAGSHTVQWNFRPVSLTIGMWGSMLFVLISGGVAVVVQRRVATTRGRGTDSTPVVGESPPPGNPPSSRTTT